MNTDRVTRSRARTIAATGETPCVSGLPDQKTAGTARTTRRRAAAAGATAAAAAAPSGEAVAPVVLFDVTNEQEGAAAPAAAARPESPEPHEQAQAAAGDEPPATPAQSVPASPEPAAPGATPTGLGLSNLPPMSPLLAMSLHSKTPAATPLIGVDASNPSKVTSALHAAAQALGSGDSPAAAAQPEQQSAAGAGEQADLLFHGFGSPLKAGADSPEAAAVSIGAAIPAAAAGLECDAACGDSPASAEGQGFERELTLEEMMGTPFPWDREETPGEPTPTFSAASAARPAARAAAAAPVVRTVQKAHPLTPARQVVLEEEKQDYIMRVEEAEGQQQQEAATAGPAAPAEPTPVQDEEMAAGEEAAAKPRLASKVVVPSPGVFDPRSLRQLKRQVADRLAAKQAEVESEDEGEDGEQYIGTSAVGDELAGVLGALSLEPGTHGPLLGLPTPAGTHIRFDDDGEVAAVSPRQKTFLRGLPEPRGTHIHFD